MGWLFISSLRPYVALAAGASLVLNLALLVPSLFTLQVFDRVFASRSMETLTMLGAITLLALGLAYCMDVARSRALAAAGRMVQRLLGPAALEQAMLNAAAGRGRSGTDRMRDVAQLRTFLNGSGVRAIFDAPWLPVYLAVIALMHPLLAVAATVAALSLALLTVVTERATRLSTDAAHARSRSVARVAESLTRHAEVVVAMGASGHAIGTWRERHEALLDEQVRIGEVAARLAALARIARQGVQVMVLAIGAWLVVDSGASPGIMIAATILLGRALQPVEQLIGGWKQLIEARGAWRRLSEPDPRPMRGEGLSLPAPKGRLDVERVVFTHDPERPAVIKSISFSIAAGESLGIAGESGSGKSTLARLLLGVWQPQHGAVRLDGANIAQWDRGELGAHLGFLPQDASLLDATIAQNIARLGPVDSDRVVAAARQAQAHDMILRLPHGYDTRVGDAGGRLSGGQRQRVALARALYGEPRLVVLDEPDAFLDAEGQDALKAALGTLKARGCTVVMVGHRTGLLAQMDKIAVIKDGALLAFGPTSAILASHATNVHALRAPSGSREAAA